MDKNIEDRYVVILAVLTQFIACFVGSMITIGLRDMQMDLSLNSWQVNLLSIIYYIVISFVLWLGLPANDLKLLSAIVVAFFLGIPYWKNKIAENRVKPVPGGDANA